MRWAMRAKAEALIARMDADLRELAAHQARARHPRRWAGAAAALCPAALTLFNAVLEAAGGVNIAANDGYYDVEGLIAARAGRAGLWR